MADVITCARRRPLGGAAVAETASDWLATTGSATVNAKARKTARTQLGIQSLFRCNEVPYPDPLLHFSLFSHCYSRCRRVSDG